MVRFITAERKVDQSQKRPVEVLALGLPRCATSSLQEAFEKHLSLSPVHHMAETMPFTPRLKLFRAALLETDRAKRQKLLHEMFDGYVAITDAPGCYFFDDLMEMYPDAKIIVNRRRNVKVWEESIQGTLQYFTTKQWHLITWWSSTDYWLYQAIEALKVFSQKTYGFPGPFTAPVYEQHFKLIEEKCKAEDREYLEFEPSMGWGPLCKFLDKPVPDAKFPHVNDTANIRFITRIMLTRGIILWAGVLSAPVVGWWLVNKLLY